MKEAHRISSVNPLRFKKKKKKLHTAKKGEGWISRRSGNTTIKLFLEGVFLEKRRAGGRATAQPSVHKSNFNSYARNSEPVRGWRRLSLLCAYKRVHGPSRQSAVKLFESFIKTLINFQSLEERLRWLWFFLLLSHENWITRLIVK